jgi:hypothetical protein
LESTDPFEGRFELPARKPKTLRRRRIWFRRWKAITSGPMGRSTRQAMDQKYPKKSAKPPNTYGLRPI